MIKVTTQKGDTHLEIKGNVVEITADANVIIHAVYAALPSDSRDLFKSMFFAEIIDPDSAIWKPVSDSEDGIKSVRVELSRNGGSEE